MSKELLEKLNSMTISYVNIADVIDELFPEFIASNSYYREERDLSYVHLGNLCLMALEDLDSRTDLDLAERLLLVTNYIINKEGYKKAKNGDNLENLFGVEVFETLTGYKQGARLAKRLLSGRALESFHETAKSFHTDEFLEEYFKLFNVKISD